jgi:DNA-binding transcriptional MerR regulator
MSVGRKRALVRLRAARASTVSAEEAAARCGVHPVFIERLVRLGLCEPVTREAVTREWIFDGNVVPLVHKIIRLRNDLGINYAGVGVVLELLSRIERLEAELRRKESEG